MPDKVNVERLITEAEKLFIGQPAVDVYNVLCNLLGHTLARSGNPGMMLMQTIQALAFLANIECEKIEADNEEDEESDRAQSTH